MTKKTAHPLELVRLSHDWSFQELADHIDEEIGHTRNQDCLRRICQDRTKKPTGRTQHLIDQFLAAVNNNNRKRKAS